MKLWLAEGTTELGVLNTDDKLSEMIKLEDASEESASEEPLDRTLPEGSVLDKPSDERAAAELLE